MKKISFIGLGLLFLVGCIIPFSSASRDVYHTYMTNRHTQDISDNQQILNRMFDRSRNGIQSANTGIARNLRNSSRRDLNKTITRKSSIATQTISKKRVYVNRTAPWRQPLVRQSLLLDEQINTETGLTAIETYENDTFSIQIPTGWNPTTNLSHYFVSPYSDLTLSINLVEAPCENLSFTQCAINMSKSLDRQNKEGILIRTSSTSRLAQYSNTILHSRIQTQVLMEGFATNLFGEDMYIARYFVADLDSNVYELEVRFPLKETSQYLGLTKRIFDSFRIY